MELRARSGEARAKLFRNRNKFEQFMLNFGVYYTFLYFSGFLPIKVILASKCQNNQVPRLCRLYKKYAPPIYDPFDLISTKISRLRPREATFFDVANTNF